MQPEPMFDYRAGKPPAPPKTRLDNWDFAVACTAVFLVGLLVLAWLVVVVKIALRAPVY